MLHGFRYAPGGLKFHCRDFDINPGVNDSSGGIHIFIKEVYNSTANGSDMLSDMLYNSNWGDWVMLPGYLHFNSNSNVIPMSRISVVLNFRYTFIIPL